MIRKFIEAISSQIENDKLTKELEKERRINEQLLQRCDVLAIDNRRMYVKTKQMEKKLREMKSKNEKHNSKKSVKGAWFYIC